MSHALNLQLGDTAPNFEAETTEGFIVFHDWIGHSWCVFFSHPRDFTPVCTTELTVAAQLDSEFKARNTRLIGLSISHIEDHRAWINEIESMENVKVNFPLIADKQGKIAGLYHMIHPHMNERFTTRNLYIIDPEKKIRLIMMYPSTTGRNFFEVLRTIDSLQLSDSYQVATPANWNKGDDCILLADLTDQELKQLMPQSYRALKNYLRIIPDPQGSKKNST